MLCQRSADHGVNKSTKENFYSFGIATQDHFTEEFFFSKE